MPRRSRPLRTDLGAQIERPAVRSPGTAAPRRASVEYRVLSVTFNGDKATIIARLLDLPPGMVDERERGE